MRAFPSLWRWRLFAAGCVVLLVPGAARLSRADIQQPPKAHAKGERQLQRRLVAPPSAEPRQAKAYEGERVEILLQAHGETGRSLDFLVRSLPTHGILLGEPRQLTSDTAVVTYVARASDELGQDAFTYAVQSRGGLVSSPATVSIEIVGAVPELVAVPSELDFGTVDAGSSTRAEITLENHGGTADGQLRLPPPWAVEGPANYHLRRGGRQKFQIVFAPQTGKQYMEMVRIGDEDGPGVRLVGTGLGTISQPAPYATAAVVAVPTPTPANPSALPPAAALPPVATATPPPAVAAASPVSRREVPAADGLTRDNSAPLSLDTPVLPVNRAQVTRFGLQDLGATTVTLAWKPPVPPPRSYRVEMLTLVYDANTPDNLRVEWRPWAQTDFRVHTSEVTAKLRGLANGRGLTLRVVAVNEAGLLAAPSPEMTMYTLPGATWWHLTPLKGLFLALAVCLTVYVRRRIQEHRLLRELDEARLARAAASEAESQLMFHP